MGDAFARCGDRRFVLCLGKSPHDLPQLAQCVSRVVLAQCPDVSDLKDLALQHALALVDDDALGLKLPSAILESEPARKRDAGYDARSVAFVVGVLQVHSSQLPAGKFGPVSNDLTRALCAS